MPLPMIGTSLTPQEAEKRRDRLATVLKWGAVAAVAIVIAPLLFTLLAATVAAVLTGVIAMVTVAAAPVLSMKLANWKMKAILAEARRNPIPTLENELIARHKALSQTKEHLARALAAVEGFITQAEDAAKRYPDMRDRLVVRAAKAKELANAKKGAYEAAVRAVGDFEAEVERARVEWQLVVAEAAMSKSLDAAGGDAMAQLKARTALDEVTSRMNQAFASLEIALLDAKAVSNPGVIDVEAVEMTSPPLLRQINAMNSLNDSHAVLGQGAAALEKEKVPR
jgi:hypothetical protein